MSLILKLARQAQHEAARAHDYDNRSIAGVDDLTALRHEAENRMDGLCRSIAFLKAETADEAMAQLAVLANVVEDTTLNRKSLTKAQYKANQAAQWRLLFSIRDVIAKHCQTEGPLVGEFFPHWCNPWRTEAEEDDRKIARLTE